jgi:hypothetical protein
MFIVLGGALLTLQITPYIPENTGVFWRIWMVRCPDWNCIFPVGFVTQFLQLHKTKNPQRVPIGI